ncbi:MAG: type 1 glutamine amidotransferase [Candidatus Binatia bacterium]|nr:type 1 glutamine amidotransferase [Candidatus Binatia bacterium]
MRVHYLQHVPFEGLGYIAPWLQARGYEITGTRFFASATLPEVHDLDLLIIMGGPMSANDEELPWLRPEKLFIRRCIEAGKAVLGICLGAQLIASALGARVYRNPEKEIGWFPVHGVSSHGRSLFRVPPLFTAFHWHGDTFDLPPGAVRLARSEACENQAFQLGRSVIGLQFHLEMTPASTQEIIAHCRAELSPARYVQSEAAILAASPETYRETNDLMAQLLSFLTTTRSGQE